MLDSVFPAIDSLVRLHAALAAQAQGSGSERSANKLAESLPDARTGDFTFLLADPPFCCPGWHRGKKERAWTTQVRRTNRHRQDRCRDRRGSRSDGRVFDTRGRVS